MPHGWLCAQSNGIGRGATTRLVVPHRHRIIPADPTPASGSPYRMSNVEFRMGKDKATFEIYGPVVGRRGLNRKCKIRRLGCQIRNLKIRNPRLRRNRRGRQAKWTSSHARA